MLVYLATVHTRVCLTNHLSRTQDLRVPGFTDKQVRVLIPILQHKKNPLAQAVCENIWLYSVCVSIMSELALQTVRRMSVQTNARHPGSLQFETKFAFLYLFLYELFEKFLWLTLSYINRYETPLFGDFPLTAAKGTKVKEVCYFILYSLLVLPRVVRNAIQRCPVWEWIVLFSWMTLMNPFAKPNRTTYRQITEVSRACKLIGREPMDGIFLEQSIYVN